MLQHVFGHPSTLPHNCSPPSSGKRRKQRSRLSGQWFRQHIALAALLILQLGHAVCATGRYSWQLIKGTCHCRASPWEELAKACRAGLRYPSVLGRRWLDYAQIMLGSETQKSSTGSILTFPTACSLGPVKCTPAGLTRPGSKTVHPANPAINHSIRNEPMAAHPKDYHHPPSDRDFVYYCSRSKDFCGWNNSSREYGLNRA